MRAVKIAGQWYELKDQTWRGGSLFVRRVLNLSSDFFLQDFSPSLGSPEIALFNHVRETFPIQNSQDDEGPPIDPDLDGELVY